MLPQAFTDRMKQMLQDEYSDFVKSYEETKNQALRLNPLKGDGGRFLELCPFHLSPVLWNKDGYYYDEQDKPGKHPYHEAGAYYIQEASAMAPVTYMEVRPGEKILDLCASPGGKTTQIAAAMGGKGILVCNEIHPARAKILSENVERMASVRYLVLVPRRWQRVSLMMFILWKRCEMSCCIVLAIPQLSWVSVVLCDISFRNRSCSSPMIPIWLLILARRWWIGIS